MIPMRDREDELHNEWVAAAEANCDAWEAYTLDPSQLNETKMKETQERYEKASQKRLERLIF